MDGFDARRVSGFGLESETGGQPNGVKLVVLAELRDEAAERAKRPGPPRDWRAGEDPPSRRGAGEPLTTEDVCFEIVRERTRTTRSALFDTIPAELCGECTVFVSHTVRARRARVPAPMRAHALRARARTARRAESALRARAPRRTSGGMPSPTSSRRSRTPSSATALSSGSIW